MDVCEPHGHSHRKRLYTDALSELDSTASEDTAYSVCGDILIGHITLTATENVEETQRKYLYFVSALASPCYARLRDLWLSIRADSACQVADLLELKSLPAPELSVMSRVQVLTVTLTPAARFYPACGIRGEGPELVETGMEVHKRVCHEKQGSFSASVYVPSSGFQRSSIINARALAEEISGEFLNGAATRSEHWYGPRLDTTIEKEAAAISRIQRVAATRMASHCRVEIANA